MGVRVRARCSWCGSYYKYRYDFVLSGLSSMFVLYWDILTLFWFWWHPHFCSTSCKLAYQKHKGPNSTGIMRDIFFIQNIIRFFSDKSPEKRPKADEQKIIEGESLQETIPCDLREQTEIESIHQEESVPNVQEQETSKFEEPTPVVQQQEINKLLEGKSEERYYYLREEDRIYTALKFKERKGFFRRVLPASWFLTFIFYGVIAFIVFFTSMLLADKFGNENVTTIVGIVFLVIVPIILWVIGIKKRVKYLKEKKKWKECTNSGKRPLELVFKEFQEMENEYRGQKEKTDIEEIKK